MKITYTQVPNMLLENIITTKITGTELVVLLAIVRLTYGWHHDEAEISASLISQLTFLDRSYVHRLIKKIEKKGLISVSRNGRINKIKINYFPQLWKVDRRKKKG